MKKTPSLYMRNYETDRKIRDEVVPGSEWVLAGEGVATRKWDGTCCLFRDGKLWKRYDRKLTKQANKQKRSRTGKVLEPLLIEDFKVAPAGWFACHDEPDLNTGHWPGWLPVTPEDPSSKWHRAAYQGFRPHGGYVHGQTYELCGPHFQGNPEGFDRDLLIEHGLDVLDVAPLTFDGIRTFLADNPMEGIVWHLDDDRRVKVKASDFGIPWPRP